MLVLVEKRQREEPSQTGSPADTGTQQINRTSSRASTPSLLPSNHHSCPPRSNSPATTDRADSPSSRKRRQIHVSPNRGGELLKITITQGEVAVTKTGFRKIV